MVKMTNDNISHRFVRELVDNKFQSALTRLQGNSLPITFSQSRIDNLNNKDVANIQAARSHDFIRGWRSSFLGGAFAQPGDITEHGGTSFAQDFAYGTGHFFGFMADMHLLDGMGKAVSTAFKGVRSYPTWNKQITTYWNQNPDMRRGLVGLGIVKPFRSNTAFLEIGKKRKKGLFMPNKNQGKFIDEADDIFEDINNPNYWKAENGYAKVPKHMAQDATGTFRDIVQLRPGELINGIVFGGKLGVRDMWTESIFTKKFGVTDEYGNIVIEPDNIDWGEAVKAGFLGAKTLMPTPEYELLQTPFIRGFSQGPIIHAGAGMMRGLVGWGYRGPHRELMKRVISEGAFFGALESMDYVGEEEFWHKFGVGTLVGGLWAGAFPALAPHALHRAKAFGKDMFEEVKSKIKTKEGAKEVKEKVEEENNIEFLTKKFRESLKEDDPFDVNVILFDKLLKGEISSEDVIQNPYIKENLKRLYLMVKDVVPGANLTDSKARENRQLLEEVERQFGEELKGKAFSGMEVKTITTTESKNKNVDLELLNIAFKNPKQMPKGWKTLKADGRNIFTKIYEVNGKRVMVKMMEGNNLPKDIIEGVGRRDIGKLKEKLMIWEAFRSKDREKIADALITDSFKDLTDETVGHKPTFDVKAYKDFLKGEVKSAEERAKIRRKELKEMEKNASEIFEDFFVGEKRADIKRLIEKSTNPQAASLGVLTSLGKELPKDVKKLIAKNLGIRVKDINKILKSNIFEKWNKENPKYESEELKIPDGYAADNADAMRMRREGMEIVNLIPGTNRVDVKKYQEVANKAVKSQQRRIQRNKDLRSVKRKDGTYYMTPTHRRTNKMNSIKEWNLWNRLMDRYEENPLLFKLIENMGGEDWFRVSNNVNRKEVGSKNKVLELMMDTHQAHRLKTNRKAEKMAIEAQEIVDNINFQFATDGVGNFKINYKKKGDKYIYNLNGKEYTKEELLKRIQTSKEYRSLLKNADLPDKELLDSALEDFKRNDEINFSLKLQQLLLRQNDAPSALIGLETTKNIKSWFKEDPKRLDSFIKGLQDVLVSEQQDMIRLNKNGEARQVTDKDIKLGQEVMSDLIRKFFDASNLETDFQQIPNFKDLTTFSFLNSDAFENSMSRSVRPLDWDAKKKSFIERFSIAKQVDDPSKKELRDVITDMFDFLLESDISIGPTYKTGQEVMKSLDKKRFYDTAFPVARKMVERMFEDLVFNGSYKKPVEVDSKYFPEDFVDMVARKFGTLDRATGKYKINDMSVQKASRAFAQHMLFKMMGKSNDAKFFAKKMGPKFENLSNEMGEMYFEYIKKLAKTYARELGVEKGTELEGLIISEVDAYVQNKLNFSTKTMVDYMEALFKGDWSKESLKNFDESFKQFLETKNREARQQLGSLMQDFEKAKEARLEEEIFRELERDFDLKKENRTERELKGLENIDPETGEWNPDAGQKAFEITDSNTGETHVFSEGEIKVTEIKRPQVGEPTHVALVPTKVFEDGWQGGKVIGIPMEKRKDGSFSTFQSGDIIELSIDTEKGITMAAGETYEGSKPVAKQGTPLYTKQLLDHAQRVFEESMETIDWMTGYGFDRKMPRFANLDGSLPKAGRKRHSFISEMRFISGGQVGADSIIIEAKNAGYKAGGTVTYSKMQVAYDKKGKKKNVKNSQLIKEMEDMGIDFIPHESKASSASAEYRNRTLRNIRDSDVTINFYVPTKENYESKGMKLTRGDPIIEQQFGKPSVKWQSHSFKPRIDAWHPETGWLTPKELAKLLLDYRKSYGEDFVVNLAGNSALAKPENKKWFDKNKELFNEALKLLRREQPITIYREPGYKPQGGRRERYLNIHSKSPGAERELSNLAPRKFTFDGKEYVSVEHAYQTLKSGKFDEATYKDKGWEKPYAKVAGKKKADKANNISLMKKLLKASLNQNPRAMGMLIYTNGRILTHQVKDKFWAEWFPKLLSDIRFKQLNPKDPNLMTVDEWEKKAKELSETYGKDWGIAGDKDPPKRIPPVTKGQINKVREKIKGLDKSDSDYQSKYDLLATEIQTLLAPYKDMAKTTGPMMMLSPATETGKQTRPKPISQRIKMMGYENIQGREVMTSELIEEGLKTSTTQDSKNFEKVKVGNIMYVDVMQESKGGAVYPTGRRVLVEITDVQKHSTSRIGGSGSKKRWEFAKKLSESEQWTPEYLEDNVIGKGKTTIHFKHLPDHRQIDAWIAERIPRDDSPRHIKLYSDKLREMINQADQGLQGIKQKGKSAAPGQFTMAKNDYIPMIGNHGIRTSREQVPIPGGKKKWQQVYFLTKNGKDVKYTKGAGPAKKIWSKKKKKMINKTVSVGKGKNQKWEVVTEKRVRLPIQHLVKTYEFKTEGNYKKQVLTDRIKPKEGTVPPALASIFKKIYGEKGYKKAFPSWGVEAKPGLRLPGWGELSASDLMSGLSSPSIKGIAIKRGNARKVIDTEGNATDIQNVEFHPLVYEFFEGRGQKGRVKVQKIHDNFEENNLRSPESDGFLLKRTGKTLTQKEFAKDLFENLEQNIGSTVPEILARMFESNVTFKVKKQNLSPEHKMTLINDFANLSDYYKQYQQGLITKADFLYRASNLGRLISTSKSYNPQFREIYNWKPNGRKTKEQLRLENAIKNNTKTIRERMFDLIFRSAYDIGSLFKSGELHQFSRELLGSKEIYKSFIPTGKQKFKRSPEDFVKRFFKDVERYVGNIKQTHPEDYIHFQKMKGLYELYNRMGSKAKIDLIDVLELKEDVRNIPFLLLKQLTTTDRNKSGIYLPEEHYEAGNALPHVLHFIKTAVLKQKEIPLFFEKWQLEGSEVKDVRENLSIKLDTFKRQDGGLNYSWNLFLRNKANDVGSSSPDFSVVVNPKSKTMSEKIYTTESYSIDNFLKVLRRAGRKRQEDIDVDLTMSHQALEEHARNYLRYLKEGKMDEAAQSKSEVHEILSTIMDGGTNLVNLEIVDKNGNPSFNLRSKAGQVCGSPCPPGTWLKERLENIKNWIAKENTHLARGVDNLKNSTNKFTRLSNEAHGMIVEMRAVLPEAWKRDLIIPSTLITAGAKKRGESDSAYLLRRRGELYEEFFGKKGKYVDDPNVIISKTIFNEAWTAAQEQGRILMDGMADLRSVKKKNIKEWTDYGEFLQEIVNEHDVPYYWSQLLLPSPNTSKAEFQRQASDFYRIVAPKSYEIKVNDLIKELDFVMENNLSSFKLTEKSDVKGKNIPSSVKVLLDSPFLKDERYRQTKKIKVKPKFKKGKKAKVQYKTVAFGPTLGGLLKKTSKMSNKQWYKNLKIAKKILKEKVAKDIKLLQDINIKELTGSLTKGDKDLRGGLLQGRHYTPGIEKRRMIDYAFGITELDAELKKLQKQYPKIFDKIQFQTDPAVQLGTYYASQGRSWDNALLVSYMEDKPINLRNKKDNKPEDTGYYQISKDYLLTELRNGGDKKMTTLYDYLIAHGFTKAKGWKKKLKDSKMRKELENARHVNEVMDAMEGYNDYVPIKESTMNAFSKRNGARVIVFKDMADNYNRMYEVMDIEKTEGYKQWIEWSYDIKRLIMYNPLFHGWNLGINALATQGLDGIPKSEPELNEMKKLMRYIAKRHGWTKRQTKRIEEQTLDDWDMTGQVMQGLSTAWEKNKNPKLALKMPVDLSHPMYQVMVDFGFPLGKSLDLGSGDLMAIDKSTGETWKQRINKQLGYEVFGDKVRNFFDDILFETMSPAFEATIFYRTLHESMKSLKKKGYKTNEARDLAGGVAERIATIMSGKLHKLDLPKVAATYGRGLWFAQNWTISNAKILLGMFGQGNVLPEHDVTGKILQRHFTTNVMKWMFFKWLFSQLSNMAVTGKPTWENEPARRDRVAVMTNPEGGYYFIDANRFINDLWNFARPSAMSGGLAGGIMASGLAPGGTKLMAAALGTTVGGAIGAGVSKPASEFANKWLGLPHSENAITPQLETIGRKLHPLVTLAPALANNVNAWSKREVVSGDHNWAQQGMSIMGETIAHLTPINNNQILTDSGTFTDLLTGVDWRMAAGLGLGFWVSKSRNVRSYAARQGELESRYRRAIYKIQGNPNLSEDTKDKMIDNENARYQKNRERLMKELMEYIEAYRKEAR